MRGILIDPKARTITTCEVDGNNCLQSLCTLMRCSIVEQIHLGGADIMLVDEEGKLTYPNKDGYFMLSEVDGIIAGCAVILASGKHDWKSTRLLPSIVKNSVIWGNPEERLVKPRAFIFSW